MKKQIGCLIFLLMALIICTAGAGAKTDFAAIDAQILSKQIPQIEDAIKLIHEHLAQQPLDGEGLWYMAKAHLYLGDELKAGQLEIYEKGKEYAEQAVEILPNSPHSHYFLSALIGRVGQIRGILSSLFMVSPMKSALDRVLELDQDYADAYWVLSQLYHQAPGFPLSIGNKKLALENAEKAVNLDANNVEYQLQLAKALENDGQKVAAKQKLTELLEMPGLSSEPLTKAEATELLAKLSK